MADVPPFIIWTQRRTGGTTLTGLLKQCAELDAWQDEAFNADRQHGAIARAYEASGDTAALDAPVARVMAQRKVLKHCLETVAWPVTRAVLRQACAVGYRHVLLLRLDETQRLLSLLLAELTGAWSKHDAETIYRDLAEGRRSLPPVAVREVRAHINAGAACLGRMVRAFLLDQVDYHTVFYEELFSGPEALRRTHFDALATYLGLPARPAEDALLHAALMGNWQRTRTIYHFLPNLAEVVAVIGTEA